MASIDNISVEAFKALFNRDFPYLPVWVADKAYFKDDIVFETLNFYISLVDNNTTEPALDVANTAQNYSHKWKLYNDSTDNYISDADIQRAFSEAKVNFNPNFFPDDATAEMVFYYLAAHYLVVDLNNAMNPLAYGFNGFTQSKSVGSVSESYGIPQWIMTNPILSQYAQTGYGRKYLSLIMPYLHGNVFLVLGRTT